LKVWHYLYFNTRPEAASATDRLRTTGNSVELRQSDPQWLVLVEQDLPATNEALEGSIAHMESLAESLGGEYDGWEREVS